MMRRLAAIAIAAAAFGPAPPAFAQDKLDWVPMRTTQGCVYFITREDAEVINGDGMAFTWEPGCSSGQPINGPGLLRGTKPNERWERRGNMVGGYWNGPQVRQSLYFEKGAWVSDPEMAGTSNFQMGYLDFQDDYGCHRAPAGGGWPAGMRPAASAPARAPVQQQAVAPPPRAPMPAPAPAPTTASSGRALPIHNPANDGAKCVTAEMKGGSQQFVNRCPWVVWVAWPGGLEDISPGESYPTFQKEQFLYYACRKDLKTTGGLYQTPEMRARHEVICDAK